MAGGKQRVIEKNKDVEKGLKALEKARTIRRKITQSHGTFPEINSLIRQVRGRPTSDYE